MLLTKKEIEDVIDSSMSIVDFCKSKGISDRTFYDYKNKYNITKTKYQVAENKKRSLIGKKINRWTVIDYVGRINSNTGMLKCRCDCGTLQNIKYYDIKTNQTKGCNLCSKIERSKSCGKYQRKTGKDHPQFSGYEEISGQRWSVIRSNAKTRKLEFSITKEYVYNLLIEQDFKCKLSGLNIDLGKPGRKNVRWTATLDRIDSTKGYIEGNVQWLHKDINTMKWNFQQDQFIQYCRMISENNKNEDSKQNPL